MRDTSQNAVQATSDGDILSGLNGVVVRVGAIAAGLATFANQTWTSFYDEIKENPHFSEARKKRYDDLAALSEKARTEQWPFWKWANENAKIKIEYTKGVNQKLWDGWKIESYDIRGRIYGTIQRFAALGQHKKFTIMFNAILSTAITFSGALALNYSFRKVDEKKNKLAAAPPLSSEDDSREIPTQGQGKFSAAILSERQSHSAPTVEQALR